MKKFFVLLLLLPAFLQAQERDFRLMSFNMERGDLGVAKGRGWDVRAVGALAMLKHQNPDILGVQECNSIQRDDILAAMPYESIGVAVSGAADDYPKTSGNNIFYKPSVFDLLDSGQFWYAFDSDAVGTFTWYAKKPRSATWGHFRHKASGREFVYINNHTQNGVDAVVNRTMSFMELLSKMREINPEGLPMLYSGDLNSSGKEYYYTPLRQEMKEAVNECPITDRGITFGGYKRKDGEGNQIDHIFFSGALQGLRFSVDRDSYEGVDHVSDHFPIYADFKFTPSAPGHGEYWFDLKPAESDMKVTAGTWNLFSTAEREERGAPAWKEVKADAGRIIGSLGVDIMGFQELTEPMARDLKKLVKDSCGKTFKLWTAYSDPSADNPSREAVALMYNSERFSVSRQRQVWIGSGDMFAPQKAWGDQFRSLLTAVFKDKLSGRQFFVMTGKLCRGENPVKYEGNVIKKIEGELNPEGLPCLFLVDMNCAPKNHVWLSLLNYWSDSYTLMYPFPDTVFSTRVAETQYESNSPKDWSSKTDLVCINKYVENRIIVIDHKVHREEVRSCAKFPSDHYPVTSTLAFK